MKKLLALMTAIALMLCAAGVAEVVPEEIPEALAEAAPEAAMDFALDDETLKTPELPAGPALTTELRNVTLTSTVGGEVQTMPLDDLWAVATLDTTELLQLGIGVYRGVEALAFVHARLDGDRLLLGFDGLDSTYEVPVPGLTGQDTSALPLLARALLPGLMGHYLPPIHAAIFPKLDLSALAQPFVVEEGVESGATVQRFAVPEATVAEAFKQLSAEIKASEDRFPGGELLTAVLDSYPSSGMRISLEGTITDQTDVQTGELNVMITGNEEPAELPTFVLSTRSVENSFQISFGMPNEGNTYELARLDVTSDVEADAMTMSMNALGILTADLSVAPASDGMQRIDMNLESRGSVARLGVQYGLRDGQYTTSVSWNNGVRNSLQIDLTGLPDETGAFVGALSFDSFDGVRRFGLTADYTQRLGESGLTGREMPLDVVPIDALTSEDLAYAFEPLTDTLRAMLGVEAEEEQP